LAAIMLPLAAQLATSFSTPAIAEVRFGRNVRVGGHDFSNQSFNRNRRAVIHIYDRTPSRPAASGAPTDVAERSKSVTCNASADCAAMKKGGPAGRPFSLPLQEAGRASALQMRADLVAEIIAAETEAADQDRQRIRSEQTHNEDRADKGSHSPCQPGSIHGSPSHRID